MSDILAKYGVKQEPVRADILAKYGVTNAPQQEEQIPEWESGLRGAAQGATFGLSDEATALLESAVTPKTYDEALKETRDLYKKAQEANPISYTGGEIVSGIAPSFIPGLNVAKAGSLVGAAGRSALSAALYGAGTSEGDKLDRIKSAMSGSVVGAGTGALGYGIAKGLEKLAPKLAVNATGATGREQQFKLRPDTGEELLKNNFVKWGDTPESIARRSEKALEETSNNIGKSLKSLDKVAEVPKDQILANLVTEKAKLDPVAEKAVINKLDDIIESIGKENQGNYAFSEVWDRKKKFDKMVNWLKWRTDPEKAQADFLTSKALREAVTDPAAKLAPELSDKFNAERKMFSLLKPVNEASERRAAVMNARTVGGLLDIGSSTLGGAIGAQHDGLKGGIEGALTGYAISHGIAPRMAATAARSAYSPFVRGAVQRGASLGIPLATQNLWKNIGKENK